MRAALVLVIVAACHREQAVLICMNANCVAPIDVARDNTMEALRESLLLEWHGRPAFDGIEIDTVWDAGASRCVFAYLYDTAEGAFDARDAAHAIADHVRRAPADRPFYFKVQGKFRVAPSGRDPTLAEMEAHCDCDLELAEIVEAAAREVGRPITVLLGEEPAQVAVLVERPRWRSEGRLLVFKIDEAPRGDTRIGAIAIEATGLRGRDFASARELEDRGIAVQLWSRYLSVEAMHVIEAIRPTMFVTNDVLSARLYLGPTDE